MSAAVLPEARLIRFVAGPDGVVVPDLGRRLPGRGMWVEATRAAVETAAKRGAFARSAKAKLTAPPGLADLVDGLLARRVLDGLGLARRAGELTFGAEKSAAAIEGGRAAWIIEAADGAEDGRRKIMQSARRAPTPPRVFGAFTTEHLSLALGLGNVVHAAFLKGRGAERWAEDVDRLAGFRPLTPETWREGPWREGPR